LVKSVGKAEVAKPAVMAILDNWQFWNRTKQGV
jgi:hypothetical protein